MSRRRNVVPTSVVRQIQAVRPDLEITFAALAYREMLAKLDAPVLDENGQLTPAAIAALGRPADQPTPRRKPAVTAGGGVVADLRAVAEEVARTEAVLTAIGEQVAGLLTSLPVARAALTAIGESLAGGHERGEGGERR